MLLIPAIAVGGGGGDGMHSTPDQNPGAGAVAVAGDTPVFERTLLSPAPTTTPSPSPSPTSATITTTAAVGGGDFALPLSTTTDATPTATPATTPATTTDTTSTATPAAPVEGADEGVTVRVLDGGSVREMSLGDYVAGATAAEMPPSFPEEALKAQAIAVRTLALNNIEAAASGSGRHSGAGADICTSPSCCMAFKENAEVSNEVWAAVDATDGLAVLYDGKPILAAFCSAVNGRTRSSQEVWGGALDYLVSVESSEEGVTASGHGVGMSQYGARSMALDGADAVEILTHYYTGVEVGPFAEQ